MLLDALAVVVASSYVTLGVFASSIAARLWWTYALVMFALTVGTFAADRRRRHYRCLCADGE